MHSLPVSFLPDLSHDYSEIICRAIYDKDPEDWKVKYGTGRGWQIDYAPTTTTGTLQGHIEKWHLLEYIEIALDPQRDWQILVSSVKRTLKLGYSLDGLKDIVKQNGNLNNLPPPPTNSTAPNDGASKKQANIPPFSLPSLHQHLVEFIVADDQALNIVKCNEFRRLLLFLREDLKDTDIPHCTKIKTDIIEAWKEYFIILKQDLAVRILLSVGLKLLMTSQMSLCQCLECGWRHFFYS